MVLAFRVGVFVFLDIDGVLRREGSPLYELEAGPRIRFEAVLRQLPGAEVVIASSWRGAFPLASIRGRFAVDVRHRIVGITPQALEPGRHARHREALTYMLRPRSRAGRPWVAIDDDPENYPVRENVLIVAPFVGFDVHAESWLLAMGVRYGAALAPGPAPGGAGGAHARGA